MFLYLTIILIFTVGKVFSNPSCPELLPDKLNVHLICHTHDDVGWLKTVDQYYYGSNKSISNAGVQYIIDSVVESLLRNPNRKFIYVESAFFFRWWNEQNDRMKDDVRMLVNNGQLEFINGGWSMNDEASTHYNAIIDQMTLGLAKLNETFGPVAFPTIGWQIDPFGHSKEQASLFAQMGMDALFLGRIDEDDKLKRGDNKELEMIWEGSNNLGADAFIFTSVLLNTYSPPNGFCFDNFCDDAPIMDDPLLEDYNVDYKVTKFIQTAHDWSQCYKSTKNVIMTMGNDFNFMNANSWFKNLDKLIKHVNERQINGSNVNLVYSTPSCYLKAVLNEGINWLHKTDDFFPYASDPHSYWTGYFTSRPSLKGYVRQSNNLLQVIKQIAALSGFNRSSSFTTLSEAMGVLQHHDAVSGTAKQHVTDDYAKRLSVGAAAAKQLLTDGLNILTNQTKSESFTLCPLLNISSCGYTEENPSFVVNIYNPLGRSRSHYVRVPVKQLANYTVTNYQGYPQPTQIVPLSAQLLNLPGRKSSAEYELIFYAEDVPPLGVAQYLVERNRNSFVQKDSSTKDFSNDTDIITEKGNLQLTFDSDTNKLKTIGLITADGIQYINVTQDWLWYAAKPGFNQGDTDRPSGAYIFRPDGDIREISNQTAIVRVNDGELVSEVYQEWSPWVTQVVRTYAEKNYIEMEWLIGPIPVDDYTGKEIVTHFDFEGMETNGTFYTDANGREMQKRIKDYRETWSLSLDTEPVSRNYYPVTSRFVLQSLNGQGKSCVLNDRAQGGTSLSEGEIEIMVHRRLLYDDGKGVNEPLYEQAFGTGLVVRGRHILIHSNLSTPDCDFGCQHRTIGEELLLQPLLTFSSPSSFIRAEGSLHSGLTTTLPSNLRLLTLEPWTNPGTWLIRLENYYEANESSLSGGTVFYIKTLFTDWEITNIQEVTLAANAYKEDIVRRRWNTKTKNATDKSSDAFTSEDPRQFTFDPMQIRTYIVSVVQK